MGYKFWLLVAGLVVAGCWFCDKFCLNYRPHFGYRWCKLSVRNERFSVYLSRYFLY